MIFKSTIGTSVTSAKRYVEGQGRDENGKLKTLGAGEESRARLLGGHGFGFDPKNERQADIARRQMEYNAHPDMQGAKDFYCSKDALHISLSWAPGQAPNDEEKLEASQSFMKALGMSNAQRLVYDHKDKSHPHVHIVASRIDPETGLAYDDYQRLYRGMRCAIEYDRKWSREKGEPIPKKLQWRHDLADATEALDHKKTKDILLKNEATIPKKRLDLAMAFGGHFGNQLEAAREQFVRHHDMIRLKQYAAGKTAAYTTKEIWQEETRTLSAARKLKEQTGFTVDDKILKKHADNLTLTEEQREALHHSTRDNGLAVISGEAGTGKSRTMQAIRKAYQENGYNVRGLAFTNKVVQNMQKDGFDSATIASELQRIKYTPWPDKTALMVDEAAQLSTSDTDKLMSAAAKAKAKLIMVGHAKQLGAVEKGGLFPVIERRFGSARLTEVMRNKDPEQKRAWNKMANRKFAEAVDIFAKSGSVKWNDTKAESIQKLSEDYAKDCQEKPDAERLIVAATNDEVRELNEFARRLRKDQGKIGKEAQFDTAKGPRKFGVNDRIVLNETPNPKDKKKGLINGAFGYIRGIEEQPNGKQQVEVEIDRSKDQQRRLFKFNVGLDKDNGDVSGIDHGYASTVYKSQGDTLDRTYMMHNPQATAPSNYVAMTRHRDRLNLYVSREETSGYRDLAAQLKHGADKTAAHSYMVEDADKSKLNQPQQEKTQMAQTPLRDRIEESKKFFQAEKKGARDHGKYTNDFCHEKSDEIKRRNAHDDQNMKPVQDLYRAKAKEDPKRSLYREALHRVFGTGEESRKEIDRNGGEAQRNLMDRTDQTKEGRNFIAENKPEKGRSRERSR